MSRVYDRRSGRMATRPYPKQPVTIAESTREAMAAWREDVAAWCREQDFIALSAEDQDLALQLVQQWREAVPGVRSIDGASRVGDKAAPVEAVAAAPLRRHDEEKAHRLELSLKVFDAPGKPRRIVRGHVLILMLLGLTAIGARVAGARS